MTRVPPSTPIRLSLLALAAALVASACGGGGGGQQAAKPARTVIQNKGSDTMVNVAQVWAEEYRKAAPDVEVEVSGGGSGVGIAALLKGAVDVANASRDLKPSEAEQAEKNTGKKPVGFTVGFDALAVYVHKDNPLYRDHPRAADRALRRGRQDDALVRARREDPRRLGRHDRPREPPVELRHLRVLPRARPRATGTSAWAPAT